MSSEWVQEGELSSEALQILAPSLTIQCHIQGTLQKVLCNPMVGANIMFTSYVFTHLGEHPLVPTKKTLRNAPRSILEGIGIIHDILFVAEPPELFQLKCASHRSPADTNSTHFKRNNPLVCRVFRKPLVLVQN
jgi:hypothetical protein